MKHRLKLPLTFAAAMLASIFPMLGSAETIPQTHVKIMNAIGENDLIRPYQSAFPAPVRNNWIHRLEQALDTHAPFTVFGKHQTWQTLDKVNSLTEPGIQVMKLELSSSRFAKGKLTLKGIQSATLYLDGDVVEGQDGEYSLTLTNGEHRILVLCEQVDDWHKVELDYVPDKDSPGVTFVKNSPKHRLSAKQMYDAETISGLKLSPDGKYFIWSKRSYDDDHGNTPVTTTEMLDSKTMQVVYRWQGIHPGSVSWSPNNRYVSYTSDNTLYLLDRQGYDLTKVASGLQGAYDFHWLDGQSLIFSWNSTSKKDNAITKRYRALEDRWSGWRNNAQLFLVDIKSGFIKQLTEGKLSPSLMDIDHQGRKLLLARSPVDYKAPPHELTEMVEFDIDKQSEKVLGQYRTFAGAAYGERGIYVMAGPSFADGKGIASDLKHAPNNYDTQLYFIDQKGQVEALSKDFDPAIADMTVMANGELLLKVNEQDRVQLYTYSLREKSFTKLLSQLDVIGGYSVSEQSKPEILYRGTLAVSPQKVYLGRPDQKPRLLLDTAKSQYANTRFASVKDWDFTNSKGELIDGRYYLPPDFDKNRQYPTIVYYYGGTSSVKRAFTGRWPFSLWASQGYVVYVMQPSGTTGYGQKFSAKHVNAWGKDTAQDIIDATRAFAAKHPFVDSKHMANMGASYGGFMTMYLATKTDMFAASIAHAGISNLAEYWGYGWWGYSYSGVASEGSFPWNNRKLYVDQSPLFSADKIKTPLLLLHGDSDTNVPVTESHQMYTALKLQGKDVELVEFAGDNHHINSRDHRMRWWNTILAYMDMKLKNQPLWWNTLYPEQ